MEKVFEEAQEVREAIKGKSHSEIEEEFGDLLLSVVNAARLAGVGIYRKSYTVNNGNDHISAHKGRESCKQHTYQHEHESRPIFADVGKQSEYGLFRILGLSLSTSARSASARAATSERFSVGDAIVLGS